MTANQKTQTPPPPSDHAHPLSLSLSRSGQRRCGALRDRGSLLGGRRGGQLLGRRPEGADAVGHLLRPDGRVRPGAGGSTAAASAALPAARPRRRDHRRVLAGASPHQVTERRRGCGGEGAELSRAVQPRSEARPTTGDQSRHGACERGCGSIRAPPRGGTRLTVFVQSEAEVKISGLQLHSASIRGTAGPSSSTVT